MGNNLTDSQLHRVLTERSLKGQPTSVMEAMSIGTPDLPEYIRKQLGELMEATKAAGLPSNLPDITDMVIDLGLSLVELEKFQKKELEASTGDAAQREARRRISREAGKLLSGMEQYFSGLERKLDEMAWQTKARIFDTVRDRLSEALDRYPDTPSPQAQEPVDEETRLAGLREAMDACDNQEQKKLIGDVIAFVESVRTMREDLPRAMDQFEKLEAFREIISRSFLVPAGNMRKLADERAAGYYL